MRAASFTSGMEWGQASTRVGAEPRSAFTLMELLMVIAIVAIVAALLLPAAAKAKAVAQSSDCGNNFKQLQMAWQLYTVDFNDSLPANKWIAVNWQDGCPSGYQTTSDSWVLGDATVDTQSWNIQNGCLYAYTRALQLYHCPIDRSAV